MVALKMELTVFSWIMTISHLFLPNFELFKPIFKGTCPLFQLENTVGPFEIPFGFPSYFSLSNDEIGKPISPEKKLDGALFDLRLQSNRQNKESSEKD